MEFTGHCFVAEGIWWCSCLYGWAAIAAQTGGKARAQHLPFFCRNGSRFSFRHSSLSSTNLRIDASSTYVEGTTELGLCCRSQAAPQQAWGSGQLPACLCCCPHLPPQAFDSPKAPVSTTVPAPHCLSMGPRRASLRARSPKAPLLSPCTPDPGEEPQRDYLGLVVKFIPVPRVLGAHRGVIQEQHGHLSNAGKASLTPGQSQAHWCD